MVNHTDTMGLCCGIYCHSYLFTSSLEPAVLLLLWLTITITIERWENSLRNILVPTGLPERLNLLGPCSISYQRLRHGWWDFSRSLYGVCSTCTPALWESPPAGPSLCTVARPLLMSQSVVILNEMVFQMERVLGPMSTACFSQTGAIRSLAGCIEVNPYTQTMIWT